MGTNFPIDPFHVWVFGWEMVGDGSCEGLSTTPSQGGAEPRTLNHEHFRS